MPAIAPNVTGHELCTLPVVSGTTATLELAQPPASRNSHGLASPTNSVPVWGSTASARSVVPRGIGVPTDGGVPTIGRRRAFCSSGRNKVPVEAS
jgi:hypothetical protein